MKSDFTWTSRFDNACIRPSSRNNEKNKNKNNEKKSLLLERTNLLLTSKEVQNEWNAKIWCRQKLQKIKCVFRINKQSIETEKPARVVRHRDSKCVRPIRASWPYTTHLPPYRPNEKTINRSRLETKIERIRKMLLLLHLRQPIHSHQPSTAVHVVAIRHDSPLKNNIENKNCCCSTCNPNAFVSFARTVAPKIAPAPIFSND